MDLVFATGNAGKLREAAEILGTGYRVLSPADVGLSGFDVEETGSTFRENSLLKAQALWHACGLPCFADESGLEVDALGGAPGIYSARYASDHNFASNIDRLLAELADVENRTARFRCVVTLITEDGKPRFFDGACEGRIARERHGAGGFGYDPVFVTDLYPNLTMAELSEEAKNAISHRGQALEKMAAWLDWHDKVAEENA